MTLKSLISSFSLVFIFGINCFSQTDFKPGYYITWENDTIHGLVDYRGDIRNIKFCVFKENELDKEVKLMPTEIQAYRFIDSKYYISQEIEFKDTTQQVFLEFLVNGITDLYYYKDHDTSMYLLEDKNQNLLELTNEELVFYKEGKGYVSKNTLKYVGLLKATFSDCNEIQSDIDHIRLRHNSLIKITKDYHNYVCPDEKCIVYEKKPDLLKVNLSFYAGINISNISIQHDPYISAEYDNSIFPCFGLLVDMFLPRINEKIALQISTDITKSNFTSAYSEQISSVTKLYHISINYFPVNLHAGLKYIYPKGKFRPTVMIGGGMMYLINPEAQIKKEIIDNNAVGTVYYDREISKLYPGYISSIGVNYMKNNKQKGFINFDFRKHVGSSHRYSKNISTHSFNLNVGIYLK